MKKFLFIALATFCCSNLHAGMIMDFYAGGSLGLGRENVFVDDQTVSASVWSLGAMAGIDIPLVRAEVEYNYLTTNNNSDFHAVMLNGYFKIPSVLVKPYIGAGIGSIVGGDAEKVPAYQGMLGASLDIPVLPFLVDVEGRVMYANNFNHSADLLHYEGRVKLRYIF